MKVRLLCVASLSALLAAFPACEKHPREHLEILEHHGKDSAGVENHGAGQIHEPSESQANHRASPEANAPKFFPSPASAAEETPGHAPGH